MALRPGTKLGAYEVREQIGAGGMGEVYRATDTRLKRDVAIKVLPEEFARDPERLARFRREAQLLASLNHPNIATIHGLEEADGAHFLVMELVSGETLAETIRDSGAGTRDSGANPSRDREGAGQRRNIAAGGPLADARGTVTGAVPIDDALAITTQICEALEHAHEKGVIHRDLKPANVKLTPDGKVKVLDFGLAKAFAGDGTASNSPKPVYDSNSPTVSRVPAQLSPEFSPTIPGTIMGTAAYMSPEQARGKTVDKRTDIWALGCVLYELLTGEGAFYQSPDRKRGANQSRNQSPDREGGVPDRLKRPVAGAPGSEQHDEPDTVQDILARVLHAEPDWSLLPENTSPGIRALLRRCLEKDARKRLRDAAEIRMRIDDARDTASEASPGIVTPAQATTAAPRGLRRPVPAYIAVAWAVGAAAMIGLVVAFWRPAGNTGGATVAHVAVPLPEGLQVETGLLSGKPPLALSPDGSQLVYVASGKDTPLRLYLRALGSMESKVLPGTDGADSAFFSPDGNWIGFFAQGKLKKFSVTSGSVETLADASGQNGRGGAWAQDGTIYFAAAAAVGISKVPASGGAVQEVTRLDREKGGEVSHRFPDVLPGGEAMLYTVWTGPGADEKQIHAVNLKTGEKKVLIRGGHTGRYVPGPGGKRGYLIYARGATLMAVPFDPVRLSVGSDSPVALIEGVQDGGEGSYYAVSGAGAIAYVSGGSVYGESRLVWVDREGKVEALDAPSRGYSDPRLSPDGRRVAVTVEAGALGTWIYDLDRATLTPFVTEAGSSQAPVWSPDGKMLFYRGTRQGYRNVWRKAVDGASPEVRVTTGDGNETPYDISPDGKRLVYSKGNRPYYLRIENPPGALSPAAQPELQPVSTPRGRAARLSPDGRWIAYSSDESGRYEVYVEPFLVSGGKIQISINGGQEPIWARNGRELFFRTGDQTMVVDVTSAPQFAAGKPRDLFRGSFPTSATGATGYDVSADGRRFLMVQPAETQPAPTQIHLILNWVEQLKQKIPLK
jgi:eukaryotic-like serine/threonine-protein kinase